MNHTHLTASNPGRIRSKIFALAALASGVLLAFLLVGGASASNDPQLSYKQDVKHAKLTVTGLDALADDSGTKRICWVLDRAGNSRSWCIVRSGSRWQRSGRTIGADLRAGGTTAVLTLNPQTAGLDPGQYQWHIEATPCESTAGATGTTGTTGTPCVDRYPHSGDVRIKVRALQAVGCTVRGAAQVRNGPARGKRIALTFDDGPADDTPQFLDELKKLNIKATFFMIGRQVPGRAALLKRILAEGNQIGNHTWDHADVSAGGAHATGEITSTTRVIQRESGFRPCLMRPPGGGTGADLVSRVRALGMTSILWNVDPQDWRTPGTGSIVSNIEKNTRPGSIILEHDGGGNRSQTLAALPQYVKYLKGRGYRFVLVNDLLGYKTKYKLAK